MAHPSNIVVHEVTIDGLPRLVAMPTGRSVSSTEAIPVDAFDAIDERYASAPVEFRHELWRQLWAVGLRRPEDFVKPSSLDTIAQAVRRSVRVDVASIRALFSQRDK